MGIEDEIRKLASEREAFLAQKRADELEKLRLETEQKLLEQEQIRRRENVERANTELGKAVASEIYLPLLSDVVNILNRFSPEDWRLITLKGRHHWTETTSTYDETEYHHYSSDYEGYGLVRKNGVYSYSEFDRPGPKLMGINFGRTHYTNYDLIFAGMVNQESGIICLTTAGDRSGFLDPGLRFEKSTIPVKYTTPEELGNDLSQVRNSSSPMHIELKGLAETALSTAIHDLPEYKEIR